ncbi:PfkB family carbohydrate kinase [Phycisphaera mikurensis]|uniref:Uncharacterized protein n=1 Tax=Phycisphaera mikurensis (strain NBRC 102666 / KCTC 22515 / FYK2301M01) TaxID=1142394 RepID=I0IIK6_PHYMF|nr:PfkB family carbohydrate kinase [Phycisphaera mikurensis]MBB6442751.1 sugar/nucleoside kinase (ribokinase family) [Phycisphaera mikurensis]BAM05094.1 hypothetical protein PSMK_29350 [Phycisphaera mikurensis NBRC 102666]
MPDRQQTATAAAAALRAFATKAPQTPVLIGFDGFVDSIIRVVQKRSDVDSFTPMPTIRAFGERILAADGKSANFEFVVNQEKLGGNGPIMANAMLEATLRVAYIGALGRPNVHGIFAEFARRVEAFPVCDPGFTDAVEFGNGKLMLGKYAHVANLDADMVRAAIPEDDLRELVVRSRAFGFTNWTMLPKCESVYRMLVEMIPERSEAERPYLFVDFADPAKREDDDLAGVCRLLSTFESKARVVLGLNLSEAGQTMGVLGIGEAAGATDADGLIATAERIRAELGLHGVVVHPREGAAASIHGGSGLDAAHFRGPYIQEPRLSTGAGDNFNAGFTLGLLAGLDAAGCLACGTGTSGFYVREARSPALPELARFLADLPDPA